MLLPISKYLTCFQDGRLNYPFNRCLHIGLCDFSLDRPRTPQSISILKIPLTLGPTPADALFPTRFTIDMTRANFYQINGVCICTQLSTYVNLLYLQSTTDIWPTRRMGCKL